MNFWASSETDRQSGGAVETIRRRVEPYLNAAFTRSSLGAVEAKIRYIPIVMDEEARPRYPARSRMRKKERLYDCAPQLDYETFVSGSWNDQVRVYLNGLRECAPRLLELDASKAQAQEFLDILDRAIEELSERTVH